MHRARNPKKLVRAVVREAGGRVAFNDRHGTAYVFPDGWVVRLEDRNAQSWTAAREVEAKVRERYGTRGAPDYADRVFVDRPGKPDLDLGRLVATDHAKERLDLMRRQAGVTFEELMMAIRVPERVRWSDTHRSWVWIRGRLAVPVVRNADKFVITTVLWSADDLFEQHPRNGKALTK
jgi:hypothetical protein